jgi:hypothetical protein
MQYMNSKIHGFWDVTIIHQKRGLLFVQKREDLPRKSTARTVFGQEVKSKLL